MYNLRNESGIQKNAPVGFSWTTLFFGPFVPAIRGDLKFFLIFFAISIMASKGVPYIGALVVNVLLAAKYNEWYLKDLQQKGFIIIK